MTRINASIQPIELCDKHLLGEIFEITRIPSTIKSGKAKIQNIPESFRLGSGHVKFFYNKLRYLHYRYYALIAEAQNRGFNKVPDTSVFEDLPKELYLDWQPQQSDRIHIVGRLNEKLHVIKNLKYYSKPALPHEIALKHVFEGEINY